MQLMLSCYWRWRDQIWSAITFSRCLWNTILNLIKGTQTGRFTKWNPLSHRVLLTFRTFNLSNQLFSIISVKLLVFNKKRKKIENFIYWGKTKKQQHCWDVYSLPKLFEICASLKFVSQNNVIKIVDIINMVFLEGGW